MNDKTIAIRVDGTKYINLRKLYLEKGTNVATEIRKFIDKELSERDPVIEIKPAEHTSRQIQCQSQTKLEQK